MFDSGAYLDYIEVCNEDKYDKCKRGFRDEERECKKNRNCINNCDGRAENNDECMKDSKFFRMNVKTIQENVKKSAREIIIVIQCGI